MEGLELVAAGSGGEGFEVGLLVEEAGDAAGFGIDDDFEGGVFHGGSAGLEVAGEGPLAGDDVEDLVAHRGNGFGFDEELVGVGLRVGFEDGGGQDAAVRVEDGDAVGRGCGQLDVDGDDAVALPAERVEDEDGHAAAGAAC